jgi:hypothetical protein
MVLEHGPAINNPPYQAREDDRYNLWDEGIPGC